MVSITACIFRQLCSAIAASAGKSRLRLIAASLVAVLLVAIAGFYGMTRWAETRGPPLEGASVRKQQLLCAVDQPSECRLVERANRRYDSDPAVQRRRIELQRRKAELEKPSAETTARCVLR